MSKKSLNRKLLRKPERKLKPSQPPLLKKLNPKKKKIFQWIKPPLRHIHP
jgi:hypothetical protein